MLVIIMTRMSVLQSMLFCSHRMLRNNDDGILSRLLWLVFAFCITGLEEEVQEMYEAHQTHDEPLRVLGMGREDEQRCRRLNNAELYGWMLTQVVELLM